MSDLVGLDSRYLRLLPVTLAIEDLPCRQVIGPFTEDIRYTLRGSGASSLEAQGNCGGDGTRWVIHLRT